MSEKTLTRMDLSEAVFREVGLSRNESANLVEAVLQHMSDALATGETVKISSFGTFSVRAKTARVGRNPGGHRFGPPASTASVRGRSRPPCAPSSDTSGASASPPFAT